MNLVTAETNHRAQRIADALIELVAAMPGCRGVSLTAYPTSTQLNIEADSDGAARALSEALGCTAEATAVYEGTADETWWIKGVGFNAERGLYVVVAGPHHKQPRPRSIDDQDLGGALLAVQDASHAIGREGA